MLQGAFDYVRPIADTVLPPDERDGRACLTCRAVPRSDLTVALDHVDDRPNPLLALLRKGNHDPGHDEA